jgi:hypothetical protein
MRGKLERYVSHILASKSSRKDGGQPPPTSAFLTSSWVTESKLLAALSGGVTGRLGVVIMGLPSSGGLATSCLIVGAFSEGS